MYFLTTNMSGWKVTNCRFKNTRKIDVHGKSLLVILRFLMRLTTCIPVRWIFSCILQNLGSFSKYYFLEVSAKRNRLTCFISVSTAWQALISKLFARCNFIKEKFFNKRTIGSESQLHLHCAVPFLLYIKRCLSGDWMPTESSFEASW